MLRELKYKLNRIKRIERYWFWYKILRKDEDWDYGYLLIMIDKKLERMIKSQLSHSFGSKIHAYEMCKVRVLISKALEYENEPEEQEYINLIFDAIKKDILRWWD